jgi:hypothetical protein
MGARIKFDNGLIFTSGGQVIDPATGNPNGTFANASSYAFVPDSNVGRAYYLVGPGFGGGNGTATLRVFDINTFLPLGSITISGVTGDPTTLIRWGTNGLAFRTTSNQLFVVQTSLIPSADPVPTPTPTPSPTPSPSPSPSPTPYAATISQLSLVTNDLVYNKPTQRLYASVPSSVGSNGNSITPIDPTTGTIDKAVFIGSEPDKLALADDGNTLYASLDGANAVRRFNLQTQTPGLQFLLPSGVQRPNDMVVAPGNPDLLAIAAGSFSPVTIYDHGVARSNSSSGGAYGLYSLAFSSSPGTLYGYDNYSSGFELSTLIVDSAGATSAGYVNNLITGYGVSIKYADGLLYSTSGRVADPEFNRLLGSFKGPYVNGSIAVDPRLGRIFFVSNGQFFGTNTVITAYDLNTFLPIGFINVPTATGTPTSLVRFGTDGLAFRTTNSFGSSNSGGQVFLVRSSLVSAPSIDQSTIQFVSRNYPVYENMGKATITVTRSGDSTGTAKVDYTTSDGTASQRTRYAPSNGSLIFGPGETQRTFNVLLTDNALLDGNQTVNLTLQNASGAVLGSARSALLTIYDSDSVQPISNPDDDAQFFVRQQYTDFLNRSPDTGGLLYWTNQITRCGSDPQCIHDQRVGVADAFFFEPEFQQTGAYIYRIYKATTGSKPTYIQFISDRGRVVSGPGLDQSKSAYALYFVQSADFQAAYGSATTADQFVDRMLSVVKNSSGVDLAAQRASLIGLYDGTDNGKAAILRQVAESQPFVDAEYNQSFVLMEYFGYLRRDADQDGFDFWLAQFNKYPLRNISVQHAMVCSFITSAEYQTRFSSVITVSNRECPQ